MIDPANNGEPNSDGDQNQDGNGVGSPGASKPRDRLKSTDGKSTTAAKLAQFSSGLSAPFIRRPVMTMLLTLSIIVFGIITYKQLAVNDLPAVDYPVIQVSTSYPGANPETMASSVATPLERRLGSLLPRRLLGGRRFLGRRALLFGQADPERGVDLGVGEVDGSVLAGVGREAGHLVVDQDLVALVAKPLDQLKTFFLSEWFSARDLDEFACKRSYLVEHGIDGDMIAAGEGVLTVAPDATHGTSGEPHENTGSTCVSRFALN